MQSNNESKIILKKILLIAAMILIIPVSLIIGNAYFKDKLYFIVSMLILFYLLAAFFAVFEKKRPQVREVVVIAVMCAIGVAGRLVFYYLPNFKPVAAVVIISGVCFGSLNGAIVGAMTAFVSNFMFGQGPWTPWQMVGFALIGFFAGMIFKEGRLPKKILLFDIYGFLSVLIIYGGLLNFSTLVTYSQAISIQSYLAVCLTGLQFDISHAVATVIFLSAGSMLLPIIDRIKLKYGLFE